MYAWGTSTHGCIPLPETESSSSGGASGLLRGSKGTLVDHPKHIDIEEVFGLSDDSNNDDKSTTITQIKCGKDNSAAVLSDGRCMTWGLNDTGQLGHGHTENTITSPKALDLPFDVSSISIQSSFSAVVASSDHNQDLYTFGSNGSAFQGGMGCLAHGGEDSYYSPKLVESLVEDGCDVSQVTVGESHMTVLTTEGEVLTAGSGSYGRLGNLESVDQLYLEPVELLASEHVVQIAGGHAFSLALTSDGILHGWGRNDKGQLGDGGGLMVDMYAMESLPRPIEGQLEGRKVVQVSAGFAHTACVTESGELFFWGMGQSLEPTLISSMLNTKCVAVECGHNYTLVLTEEGNLFSFGNGKTGVLGHANTKTTTQPQLVEGLLGKKVVQMSAGFSHCAVLVEAE